LFTKRYQKPKINSIIKKQEIHKQKLNLNSLDAFLSNTIFLDKNFIIQSSFLSTFSILKLE